MSMDEPSGGLRCIVGLRRAKCIDRSPGAAQRRARIGASNRGVEDISKCRS